MEQKALTARKRLQRVLRRRDQLRRSKTVSSEVVSKIESLTRTVEMLVGELGRSKGGGFGSA